VHQFVLFVFVTPEGFTTLVAMANKGLEKARANLNQVPQDRRLNVLSGPKTQKMYNFVLMCPLSDEKGCSSHTAYIVQQAHPREFYAQDQWTEDYTKKIVNNCVTKNTKHLTLTLQLYYLSTCTSLSSYILE